MSRGGLNFLLTGKPETLNWPVATELEALLAGVELWASCCAGPVDLAFPPRAFSGELVARLLF